MAKFDNVVAIIPARADSRRLPKKNKLEFNGVPLWLNTALKATQAGLKVIISTNDDEIISYPNIDVWIHRRSSEISGDDASSESVIEDVIDTYRISDNSIICFMQCTSPLLEIATLKSALHYVIDNKCDVVAVRPDYKPAGSFYIFRVSEFRKHHKSIWLPDTHIWVLDWKQAIDIDYHYDYVIAKAINNNKIKG